ncbi:MAG: hypothetical protein GX851_04965, partial [Clostridiales bacterium]|nr:hypothetical protein [Clostridiales bacterium]
YTLEEFGRLKNHINVTLKDIGGELHAGRIPALPTSDEPCKYCDYRSVCGFEEGGEVREIPSLRHEEAINILNGGGNGDAERMDT